MDQLTPEEITGRSFRQTFRGADPAEVSEFLGRIAQQFGELLAQRDRLAGRLGEFAERDLRSEFVAVGEEIAGGTGGGADGRRGHAGAGRHRFGSLAHGGHGRSRD